MPAYVPACLPSLPQNAELLNDSLASFSTSCLAELHALLDLHHALALEVGFRCLPTVSPPARLPARLPACLPRAQCTAMHVKEEFTML